mgnify:CR=1 FL=1
MYKKRMMLQRYNKYKIKAILHFSIIICLFAHRFIYYSILLRVKDKTGIDILFKEYYPQLYYYAYHLINDIEASKDIVSDAFEFLWNNYGKVNKVTVKSYLYTYVRNKSIDYLRHQNVHQQFVQLYTNLTQDYVETDYQEWDEKMLAIQKAMQKLTPHTKHILEECYVEKKKYQEVAEELNISVSAVRKHIVKALQTIRKECLINHKEGV